MSIERELLNEVLEYFDPLGLNTEHCGDLPERIKELLAQPEKSEQEPVAWKVIDETNDGAFMFSEVKPIERYYKDYVVIPLYTAPPTREPLSDEQYMKIYIDTYQSENPITDFVRAIEKAHGIGGGE